MPSASNDMSSAIHALCSGVLNIALAHVSRANGGSQIRSWSGGGAPPLNTSVFRLALTR
jgi:hypothetical protein